MQDDRRPIRVDGEVVLDYVPHAQAQPTAGDARALAALDRVVPAVQDQLAGHWLSSANDDLVDALLAAGASIVRHSHILTLPLPVPVPVRDSVLGVGRLEVGPIDRPALDLAELAVRAYPRGHVDFETAVPQEAAVDIAGLLDGTLLGPCLPAASGQVLDGDRVVAVCVINRMANQPPWGGPWVSEVFRDPDPTYRGLGALLLNRALAALESDRELALSLAVTDGNPAEAVYRTIGFQHVASRRKISIPKR